MLPLPIHLSQPVVTLTVDICFIGTTRVVLLIVKIKNGVIVSKAGLEIIFCTDLV